MTNLPIRFLKNVVDSKRKFTITLLTLISFTLLSPVASQAQTTITTDGTSVYNEEYFKQITYQWTDAAGKTHVSNLTEPATDNNQIVAFLREVYLNPNVPGFVKDGSWNPALNDTNYPNTFVDVPYTPCLAEGNPYGMTAETVVPTPVEGCTALMVELVDDYQYTSGDSCDELINKIKRITLLTQQRYVDDTVSLENPGTLFNYVGALNNFFIVTKGNNRIPKKEADKEGFAPFYNMFEEYSPSNRLPIYNAFEDMNNGKSFSVDHNCTSIMNQNHIIVMSPEPEEGQPIDVTKYHDFGLNFMFFLPDRRFARDTRTHPDPSVTTYQGEWYTYYSDEHRPYFFFNKIIATIGNDPVIVDVTTSDNETVQKARVEVGWSSTYNDIVHYEAKEDFYVYRVVNDVIESEPLNLKELFAQNLCQMAATNDADYVLNDDGSITTTSKTTKIYIFEDYNRFAYDVHYIITGRRYLTDFEFTESNIVSNTIPGKVFPPDALNLVIEGERQAQHDIAEGRNHYKHTIKMLDSDNAIDNVTLTKKHLRATSEADVERGTTFNLMRYVGDSKEEATELVHVATLEITNAFEDQWGQWEFEYTITDVATGKKYAELGYPLPLKNIFKSKIESTHEATENAPVLAPQDTQGVLATFYDIFWAETAQGTHPDMYHYYIDYNPAVLIDGEETIEYDADSNIVEFLIPHNELKVGYVPYTKQQIEDELDYECRLPENSPGVQFSVTTNPNVESYTIYRLADNQAADMIVKATRMPTGRLSIDRATDINSALDFYGSSYKQMYPIVEMPTTVTPLDNQYALVVKYNNGNTYGNRIVGLNALPKPVIDKLYISAASKVSNGDESDYFAKFTWHTEAPSNFDDEAMTLSYDNDFQTAGYRIWRKRHGVDMAYDDPHSMLHQEFMTNEDDNEPMYAMRKAASHEVTINPNGTQTHKETFQAHEATEEKPVNYDAVVRLYTVLPQESALTEDGTPGYVVADADASKALTSYKVVTSIEDVMADDTDAPVEYFNLQGQRVNNPCPGTLLIRRQGTKVSKVLIK